MKDIIEFIIFGIVSVALFLIGAYFVGVHFRGV
jgi:hypothetical protein